MTAQERYDAIRQLLRSPEAADWRDRLDELTKQPCDNLQDLDANGEK